MQRIFLFFLFTSLVLTVRAQQTARLWMKTELSFTSAKPYDSPLYDLREFYALFTAPGGRTRKINGFWDGGTAFRIRFAPDEPGEWRYETVCSDTTNTGLHRKTGTFTCVPNGSELAIYRRGALLQPKGTYHLAYNDGTPFFWTACTAWNGALKSTEEEWDTYLQHRVDHHYSVIQFVTTQWRGADQNSLGQLAYEWQEGLKVNPAFFQHLDGKVDKINEYGLIAAPVLLWALPVGEGRHLSPGYLLPLEEAVLLARYILARYQGNQVVWLLGGDGRYAREYEQRWLEIGRRVFADDPPGLVAQHPHGLLWIGDNHAGEAWLDIVGYQSSHSTGQGTVDWINKGPVATRWPQLPARPVINLEPVYEEILPNTTDREIRNACYWSLFATPVAGITYGANGIWPWIREGETILNHGPARPVSTWRRSIDFPASIQMGYLTEFFRQFDWWDLRPANERLAEQPGDEQYDRFIAVLKAPDDSVVLAYVPQPSVVKLYNPRHLGYSGQWFDPKNNKYVEAELKVEKGLIEATPPGEGDFVLVLKGK